ncbi:hypothetical protein VFPPC_11690 [Pochonia chlamydosporia 170]|uniref:Uncharacterized protein n=1 Tax=Pochonia chlamydosporia 170 TaxID=1380566 RepID=A0A179FVF2_METCM|nr:hypothetical protein VFPPC_11690 [Pochonia chlamydosporia 170]OAQ69636.1 hypothetical protein VFPPC_11690 [Pochonia chlamydosporia 170]
MLYQPYWSLLCGLQLIKTSMIQSAAFPPSRGGKCNCNCTSAQGSSMAKALHRTSPTSPTWVGRLTLRWNHNFKYCTV